MYPDEYTEPSRSIDDADLKSCESCKKLKADLESEIERLKKHFKTSIDSKKMEVTCCRNGAQELQDKNDQLRQWVADLQSGMNVNCVYCGHRYGPVDKVPTSMADALKEHIEQCPEHPMSALKAVNAQLGRSVEVLTKTAYPDICWDCGKELAITDGGCCLDCGAPLGLEAAVRVLKGRIAAFKDEHGKSS